MMFRGAVLPPFWQVFDDSLVVRHFFDIKRSTPPGTLVKIAGFDFDDTLVSKHHSGLSFPSVIHKLRDLHAQGYCLAIFSNEVLDHLKRPEAMASTLNKKLTRLTTFLEQLNLPIHVFVATRYDEYRKPSTSKTPAKCIGGNKMWTKMLDLMSVDALEVDHEASFFVGDAGGRRGEFSDADLQFAKAVGIPFIHARDYFSGTAPLLGTKKDTRIDTTASSIPAPLSAGIVEKKSITLTAFFTATPTTKGPENNNHKRTRVDTKEG